MEPNIASSTARKQRKSKKVLWVVLFMLFCMAVIITSCLLTRGWAYGAERWTMTATPPVVLHEKSQRSVVVGFWGIGRSLSYTYPSIHECILQPLREQNYRIRIVIHTYDFIQKGCVEVTEEDWRRWLGPEVWVVVIENQRQVDEQRIQAPLRFRHFPDAWRHNHNYELTDNHLRSLYSLHQLTHLIARQPWIHEVDYVMFCRPDVLYLTKWQRDFFPNREQEEEMCLPDFHQYPVNDRFAVTTVPRMEVYGCFRWKYAAQYAQHQPLHSETFLHRILVQENVRFRRIPFRFRRIRCGGKEIDQSIHSSPPAGR